MERETLILWFIGISFTGFMAGLIGKNTNNRKKKSFRWENFFKYLTALSVITMLVLVFLYNYLYT